MNAAVSAQRKMGVRNENIISPFVCVLQVMSA
jgi:hypothetical protein